MLPQTAKSKINGSDVAQPTRLSGDGWHRFSLRSFLNDRRGSILPLAAGLIIAAVGAATIGVDYARAVATRQFLATAADAAALAAVSRLPDHDAVRATAIAYVQKNLSDARFGTALVPNDIEIGDWDAINGIFVPIDPSDPAAAGSAVRVTTRVSQSNGNALATLFAGVFGIDTMDLAATAVAGRGGPPCVLALDSTVAGAMHMGGSAGLQALGCGVQVNSTATGAMQVKGSAELEATEICVGGTADVKAGNAVQPNPKDFCPGQVDPMTGLTPPEVGPCDPSKATTYVGSDETLQPGVYCGGLDIKAGSNITLEPGLYVIKDGALSLSGNSTIQGEHVTFFLTGDDALVSFKANTTIDLTAPIAGDLTGILFYQDPAYSGTHDWKGNAATNLRGVIYFPEGTLVSKNDNAITPEGSCTVLIAKTLSFMASSGVTIDIRQSNCRSALPGPYNRGIVLLQ